MFIRILAWSAWSPSDGPPNVADIAPLLRRRMSPLVRTAVSVGLDCCRKAGVPAAEPRVVFASRHGEMGVTVDLLTQMAAGETLSPMGFSNSVHHAAVGYWSLATKNRQAMRAVAGGDASFCYGFLDAMGMLGEKNNSPVLLIAADERVPAPFEKAAGLINAPFAVALLLRSAQPGEEQSCSFDMGGRAQDSSIPATQTPALDFLQWFTKDVASLELVASRKSWRWEK